MYIWDLDHGTRGTRGEEKVAKTVIEKWFGKYTFLLPWRKDGDNNALMQIYKQYYNRSYYFKVIFVKANLIIHWRKQEFYVLLYLH